MKVNKECRVCGFKAADEKDLELFMKCNSKSTYGRKNMCKECNNKKCREWRKSKRGQAVQKEYGLQKKYGISTKDKNKLYVEQDGCCAVCDKNIPLNKMVVDHNHSTGEVRGLLCTNCNLMLGQAQDSSEILIKGAAYLEERGTYDRTRD